MSRIRELNDAFRSTFRGGQVLITAGVNALPSEIIAQALERVRTFDAFTEDNDPHGERDFGSFELTGHQFLWKIDYYDLDLRMHSPDPADPDVTARILTIMLAEDY